MSDRTPTAAWQTRTAEQLPTLATASSLLSGLHCPCGSSQAKPEARATSAQPAEGRTTWLSSSVFQGRVLFISISSYVAHAASVLPNIQKYTSNTRIVLSSRIAIIGPPQRASSTITRPTQINSPAARTPLTATQLTTHPPLNSPLKALAVV